jgi:hypothetical protein
LNNGRYYLAERNNYFFGKLMTVRDFTNEQEYFNSKRRLGNRMLNGVGIVSGLNVFLVDNKTFSLETGFALDYLGREIIVPEPSIRKLNVINGFEENKDKSVVYLCIAYKEISKESTFSVTGTNKECGSEKQFNRISEGYELFLTSKEPFEEELKIDFLFIQKVQVYSKDGIKILLEVPRYANPGSLIKIKMFFEKHKVEAPVKYSFDIRGTLFKSAEGSRNSKLEYSEDEVSTYKSIYHEIFMRCDAVQDSSTELVISKQSFSLKVGEELFEIEKNISIPIQVKIENIKNLIIDSYYSSHFDEIIESVEEKYIYLAKFHIATNKLTYFIEDFKKHPARQYIFSNDLLRLLNEFNSRNVEANLDENLDGAKGRKINSFSIDKEEKEEVTDTEEVRQDVEKEDSEIQISGQNIVTGIERINLGFNAKPGRSYYSYEFAHGLGEGQVCVVSAVVNEPSFQENEEVPEGNLLIFGDKAIFSSDYLRASAPSCKIGAIVDPAKGTLRLGIRLNEKTTKQHVKLRWWAFKPIISPSSEEDLVIDQEVKLVIAPDTVRVDPFGKTRFEARIEGLKDQRLYWSMVQEHSGSIDSNGLYTAPSVEGVYEVRATSVQNPKISNSAYVVVSSIEEQ